MRRSFLIKDTLLVVLITTLIFSIFLGARNLSAPDELRYAEIPREMIVNHDYIVPTINGVKYLEKPPLFYWMQVASIKIFGLHEFNLRLATLWMAVLGVAATYLFTAKIYSRQTAWFAALILSSMSLYFAMAHVITLDMTVSVFITLSLYAFFLAIKNQSCTAMLLGFLASAAAMMTKGLIAVIFPGLILGIWITLFQRWHQIQWRHVVLGFLIFIALVAPWHLLLQQRAPEFLHFYFVEQQLLRYTTTIAHRYQPFYFYLPVLVLGTLPWSYFLPKALFFLKKSYWRHRRQYENSWFFWLWFLSIFLFFSASDSKLIPYVLPGLPPLAILIAHYLTQQKKLFMRGLVSIYIATNIIFISSIMAVDYFDDHTIKGLVLTIKPSLFSQDEVVSYHHYYQDLPYYLQRKITVDESFDELEFGAAHGVTQQWMINEQQFKQRWLSKKTLYVFMRQSEYAAFIQRYPQHPGQILAQDPTNLVVRNHPLSAAGDVS